MRTYRVTWDTCFIIANLDDNERIVDFLKNTDDNFIITYGKLQYNFAGTFVDVEISDVSTENGVIFEGCFG